MKGFAVIVILVIFYAIFHFCVVNSQSTLTNEIESAFGFGDTNQVDKPIQGHQGPAPQGQGNLNATQSYPILETLGWSDPALRQYFSTAYGTIMGRPDCVRRALCYFGNYLRGTPGSAILLTLASPYIPTPLIILYNVFQYAMRNGQDCSTYSCTLSSAV